LIAIISFADWFSAPVELCKIQIQQPGEPNKKNETSEEYCSAGKVVGIWRAVGRFIDAWHDDVTAAATAVIAIFTIVLVVVSNRQARLTRDSVRIAERALNELEVPFIALKVIDPGLKVSYTANGAPLIMNALSPAMRLKFCFANYGRTPASLLELRAELCATNIGKSPEMIDPDDPRKVDQFGELIGPGKKSVPMIRIFREFPDVGAKMNAIDQGGADVFLIGFVRFRDIFDSRYTLGFCAKFDRKGGNFVLDGGKGYNYQTQQKPDAAIAS
jgi:hypothetical protein